METVVVQEPKESVEETDWLVYSDFCFDQGDYEGAEKARKIAAGIKKTGGTLFLWWGGLGGELEVNALIHYSEHRERNKEAEFLKGEENGYKWHERKAKNDPPDKTLGIHTGPLSPFTHPKAFFLSQKLVTDFWKTLEKIGAKELQ